MKLELFLNPLPESYESSQFEEHAIFHSIKLNNGVKKEVWLESDLAIITVYSKGKEEDTEDYYEAFRKYFYSLTKPKGLLNIVDMGMLRPGKTLQDTLDRLSEVVAYLLENKITPLIIGDTHALDLGQYKAYQNINKLINVLMVDALLDIDRDQELSSEGHLYKILTDQEGVLEKFTLIGQQGFLVNTEAVNLFEKFNFKSIRVGELKQHMHFAEPEIRNSDIVSFDTSAIRYSDAPDNKLKSPFGLTGEEACQLAWYAGNSNRTSSMGIYGFEEAVTAQSQTPKIAAVMLWHFVQAFYNFKESLYFEGSEYQKYRVAFEKTPEEIIFYKGVQSGKWWMRLDSSEEQDVTKVIPCNHEDYLKAVQGEIPERYIQEHL